MHLIHHVRSQLLASSLRLPASITAHSLDLKFRMYSSDTAAAPNTLATGELIATENVVPEPLPEPVSEISKKKTKAQKTFLSDKLRSRSSESRPDKKKPPKRKVVSAAEDAILRNHSTQDHIIRTLHQAIISDGAERKGKRKKATKQKSQKIPVLDLFALVPEKSTRIEEGWKGEEWNESWGKDELTPAKLELDPGASRKGSDSSSNGKSRSRPPHQQPPIPYTRRIEGLLEQSDKATLEDIVSPSEHKPVARLAHGLDRVLFNPGVYCLQDPRSGVYNFTTWLESIPNVKDFAFERVTGFIRSSADEDLWTLARRENRKYTGSTSSLTGMLSHIYFLISNDKDVNVGSLSRHFHQAATNFTPGQRMPASVNMNYKDGIYAFDSMSSDLSEKNVLTWMGTMLEKFLTVPQEEFSRYLKSSPEQTEDETDSRREAYRYSKSGRFVMRSQLDCVDNRLPGTGVFDIKTRAALPIRLDLLNYEENSGYLIRTLQGPIESFEKEYYDLIRSAFLKYSFQARIGNMDGVLVAYHNTARMFGFQYVALDEMDECLFGGKGRGDRVFQKCVGLLEQIVDEVIHTFPEQSLKCTFEKEEGSGVMHVWIEPLEWDEASGPCPIAQLDVSTTSYLKDTEASGARAVSAVDTHWTLHWKISKSSLSDSEIRYNLSGAKDRQFRAWSLPAGVSYQQMAEHWDTLKFGPSSKDVAYKSSYVRAPTKNIEQLRRLARSGREETQRLVAENAGKGKIVWGLPEELMAPEDLETKEGLENGIGDIEALVPTSQHDSPPAVVLEEVTDSEIQDLGETSFENFSQEIALEAEELTAGPDSAEVAADETISVDVHATDDSLSTDSMADSSVSATAVIADDIPKGVPAANTSEVSSETHDVVQEMIEGKEDAIYHKEVQGSIDQSDKGVPGESTEHGGKTSS